MNYLKSSQNWKAGIKTNEWYIQAGRCGLFVMVVIFSSLVAIGGVAQAAVFNPVNVTELITAINTANSNGVPDLINLTEGGTYTLSNVNNIDSIGDSNGLPLITSPITVEGNGATIERDSAAPAFRFFHVAATGQLTLRDVTLRNGYARLGGAVFNYGGILHIVGSTVSGNTAYNHGGGIRDFNGMLILTNSTVSGNTAIQTGGGIYPNSSTVTITNSTVSGNTAGPSNPGGGIYNYDSTLRITNSTVSGNTAGSYGGGIYFWDSYPYDTEVTITNSTVTGNTSGSYGGGIYLFRTVALSNSLVANSFGGNNCYLYPGANIVDHGNNLADDSSCGTIPGTLTGLDPNLADNGGPTETHALLTGSNAIDAGDDTVCAAAPVNGVDQRGVARPVGAHCDIGAFEFELTSVCGNGTLEYPEECDDGNVTDGDGCSSTCLSEAAQDENVNIAILDNGDGTFGYTFTDEAGVPVIEIDGNTGLIDLTNMSFTLLTQANGTVIDISGLTLTDSKKSISVLKRNIMCAVDSPNFLGAGGVQQYQQFCRADPTRITWRAADNNTCGDPGIPVAGKDASGIDLPQYTCETFMVNSDVFAKMSGFHYTAVVAAADSDGDGLADDVDQCLGTSIPESVPTSGQLGKNRWALTDGNTIFDQAPPQSGSKYTFTVDDTRGCSCEQIIGALGLGKSHAKKGCSTSVMLQWLN
jgi:cysteine-rich repeat protein